MSEKYLKNRGKQHHLNTEDLSKGISGDFLLGVG